MRASCASPRRCERIERLYRPYHRALKQLVDRDARALRLLPAARLPLDAVVDRAGRPRLGARAAPTSCSAIATAPSCHPVDRRHGAPVPARQGLSGVAQRALCRRLHHRALRQARRGRPWPADRARAAASTWTSAASSGSRSSRGSPATCASCWRRWPRSIAALLEADMTRGGRASRVRDASSADIADDRRDLWLSRAAAASPRSRRCRPARRRCAAATPMSRRAACPGSSRRRGGRRPRLCLCRALPAALGLSLHARGFDLCRSQGHAARHRPRAADQR